MTEQTVIRTMPRNVSYRKDVEVYNDLYRLLREGWKVVMCNKIGEDLEYILEKEVS